jgi:hypothetical protein
MRFFASHVWTGTHQGRDFGAKIDSAYCLIRVHNAVITASVRDVNYKQGEGEGGGGTTKHALGAQSAGVVGGGKHHKSSNDEE